MAVRELRPRDRGPKGRELDETAWSDIRELLGEGERRRDLLIEYLHLIQDRFGCLSAAHLRALAEEMRLVREKLLRKDAAAEAAEAAEVEAANETGTPQP